MSRCAVRGDVITRDRPTARPSATVTDRRATARSGSRSAPARTRSSRGRSDGAGIAIGAAGRRSSCDGGRVHPVDLVGRQRHPVGRGPRPSGRPCCRSTVLPSPRGSVASHRSAPSVCAAATLRVRDARTKGRRPLTQPETPVRRILRTPTLWILLVAGTLLLAVSLANQDVPASELTFSEFQAAVAGGEVQDAELLEGSHGITGSLTSGETLLLELSRRVAGRAREGPGAGGRSLRRRPAERLAHPPHARPGRAPGRCCWPACCCGS